MATTLLSDEIEHSLRGPSGASRWRRCAGSINAERGLPGKVGREAAQGTVFHEYAEACVLIDVDPYAFPTGVVHERDGHLITFDEDMQRYMLDGLGWIAENYRPEEGDRLFIEQRVDISPWCGPGEFGTCDICIIKFKRPALIIFDWKYGKGEAVSPVKNDQQYLYTLGVWNSFASRIMSAFEPGDIEVIFNIEQPRMANGGGIWHTDMAAVLAEGEQIRLDANETMNPNAKRTPGHKQCLFCKASGQCAEQAAYLLEVFGMAYDDIDEYIEMETGPAFESVPDLTLEARSFVLLHWKAFKRWVDKIHELTLADLRAGREVPLLKAVTGKPGRRFYRPAEIEQATAALVAAVGKDKAFETKLVSPAVIEKAVGKKRYREEISKFVGQPPGKTILVPLDDKRPAIQDFASMFDEIDEEGEDGGDE